jgi:glycosyltransferase involved in cell wall biosynthesis
VETSGRESDKTKVIHLASSAGIAGGERYLLDLIQFSSRDIEHFVILPQRGPFERLLCQSEIAYAIVNVNRKLSLKIFSNLISRLRRIKGHILHTHGYRSNFYGRLGAISTGLKNICTVHVSLFDYLDTPRLLRYAYMFAEKLMAFKTSRFICVSPAIRDDMLKLGMTDRKLCLIPNGVDMNRFYPRPVLKDKLKVLGLKKNGPVIGTVGRMVPEKGQAYLIGALKFLKTRWPDLECVFVGAGPVRDQLIKRASELDVLEMCRFCGEHADIENIYPVLDIFVLPSLREPFGLVLLEAMASGIPVITTSSGGPMDFIDHDINGCLVPPQDSRQLAQKIDDMLTDRLKATSVAENGRRTAEKFYDVRSSIQKTEDIYRSLV